MALQGEAKSPKDNEGIDFQSIQFLLKAPSKEIVKTILQQCYNDLDSKPSSKAGNLPEKIANDLSIASDEATQVISAIQMLLKEVLFEGFSDPSEVHSVFPDDFHKSLRELLSKLIAEKMPTWKSDTISKQVSLPRLVDFDWRIDVKTGSSGRLSLPSCLLQLKLLLCLSACGTLKRARRLPVVDSDTATSGHAVTREETKSLNVELTKETLDTMLDGLGKIRDQLNSVQPEQQSKPHQHHNPQHENQYEHPYQYQQRELVFGSSMTLRERTGFARRLYSPGDAAQNKPRTMPHPGSVSKVIPQEYSLKDNNEKGTPLCFVHLVKYNCYWPPLSSNVNLSRISLP
eukprot:gene18022-19826_t